jgi:hypothetical protein
MTLADVRPGLRAYLLADSGISALVGGARIYAVHLPQGETQASIVFSRISGLGDHHMQGPSGLARPRLQIDCWAASIDAAFALSNMVKERIDGFRGDMPYGANSPQDLITVRGVFFDSEREDYDDTAKLYRASCDYFIWFLER